jgi:hypothetical protein
MSHHPSRRRQLLLAALSLPALPAWAASRPVVEVWKDPNCGCCKDWIAILRQSGFEVRQQDTGNNAMRAQVGIPRSLGSCHTAMVDGYALEGHVPVREIRRLLRERPQAIGLTVPGMPVGSPGMDGPAYQGRKDPFDVLLVARNGSAQVYQSYR